MTALFRSGSLSKLLNGILSVTWEHSKRLGLFVAGYKALISALRLLRGQVGRSATGLPASSLDPALAGGLSAYLVWYGGEYSGISHQVALYLLGRVVVAACKYLAAQDVAPFSRISFSSTGYPALVVSVWAAVMWLYENEASRKHLQKSLAASMQPLYTDSNCVAVGPSGAASSSTAGSKGLNWALLLPNTATLAVLAVAAVKWGGGDLVHSALSTVGLADVHIGSSTPHSAPAAATPQQGITPAARATATPVGKAAGRSTPVLTGTTDPLRTPGNQA